MKIINLSIFVVIAPLLLPAQKHDNTWLYGKKSENSLVKITKIDFSSGAPTFIPTEFEGTFIAFSGSMSDDDGELLFYTNNCHIYDASGKIMLNGDTLNSPPTSYWMDFCTGFNPSFRQAHAAFALPQPESGHKYYLFHINAGRWDEPPSIIGLNYSVIDMDTPDHLGKVVTKDQNLLYNGLYEVAAAVRHGNGRDWWIVAPNAKTSSPILYRFLLTPNGIQGPFEQQNVFQVIDSAFYGGAQILLFTPDGSKLIQYHYYYGFIVYDFDRCTGLISNPVKVLSPVKYQYWEGLDFEISPNSRFVYIIAGGQKKIIQYDLQAPDIALSGDTVAVYDGFEYNQNPLAFGWMERGPDGKIYVIPGCCFSMHVIEQPDLKGAACDVRQHSIDLPTWIYGSLPYMPNYRLYDLPGSSCDTLGIDAPLVAAKEPPDPNLRIYPNPAAGEVRVAFKAGAPPGARVSLADVAGRVLSVEPVPAGAEQQVLSLDKYPGGMYFVRVEAAGRMLRVEKLSVIK
jgi:hypothetical protein